MQELTVKIRDPQTGEERLTKVQVHRSWSDISGRHVFLHVNGVYGYKDGAPVKAESELTTVISDPIQRERALMWWKHAGQTLSEAYYAERAEIAKKKLGDFIPDAGKASAEKDAVMYCRKETTTPGAEWSPAIPWMQLFPERPDWWGQCDMISFADYHYYRSDKLPPADDKAAPSSGTGETDADQAKAVQDAEKAMWAKLCRVCPGHADSCKCVAGSKGCQARYDAMEKKEF